MDAVANKHNEGNFGQKYPPAQPAQHYPHPAQPHPQHPQFQESARVPARNWPQFLSVGASACIIFTGGMSMAWSVGFMGWTVVELTRYMLVCWSAMVIVGAIFSAVLIGFLKKKVLMFLSSVLVMVGGILFISLDDDYGAIMAARHINGFAVGWILVITFVMAGEEGAKEVRGTLISSVEAASFSFGIFIQILYAVLWSGGFASDRIHGILVLVFGFISLVVILTQVIESPVYFLEKNQEELALESLLKLQRPSMDSAEKRAQFEDHKRYIAESIGNGSAVICALFKLCILRGIIGLSFTLITTTALEDAAFGKQFGQRMRIDELAGLKESFRGAKVDNLDYTWPFVVYCLCRFVGTLFGSFLQDRLGRKLTLTISMLICGGMAIGVGIVFNDLLNIWYSSKMWTVLVLLFVYQFFAGACTTSSSSYMTEAFPVKTKPYCIAFVLTIEMIIFIICGTIDLVPNSISEYFYALSSISFGFVVFTVLFLPETKKISLIEALRSFGTFLNTKFN